MTTPTDIAATTEETIADLDSAGGSARTVRPAGAPPAHVYDVQKWERHLYGVRKPGTALTGAVDAVAKAVYDATLKVETDKAAKENRLVKEPTFAEQTATNRAADTFVSELFSRLYGNPDRLDQPTADAPAWAGVAHDTLDNLQEFADLRAAVTGDPDCAALAAADMSGEIAPKLPAIIEQLAAEAKAEEDGEPAPNGNGPTGEDRLRAALRAACSKAGRQDAERKDGLAGLAPGLESAPATKDHGDPARMKLAERLVKDRNLREILRRAGRLARIQDRKRIERRDPNARSEVVDIERGGDLGRAMPAQLARLRHPILRRLALKDIADRSLLQYRLEGTEKLGRGPMVVLLDCSGSMSGDPHNWARAVGIACIGVAAKDKRPVTVIDFDTRPLAVRHLDAKGNATTIPVDRYGKGGAPVKLGGGKVADAALDVAGYGVHGGTDFGPVLRLALDGLPSGIADERADLVFVTDGQAGCDDATMLRLLDCKKKGLRVFGLALNGGSVTGAMRDICDKVIDLDRVAGGARDDAAAEVLPG